MTDKQCSVDGCDRSHYATGLCSMHYHRKLRLGDVGPAHPIDRVGYSVERQEYTGAETECPCGQVFRQRAIGVPRKYCSSRCRARFYQRERRAAGYERPETAPCKVDGCEKRNTIGGLCPMHYERVKKYGEPGSAVSKKRPGEWRLNADGYVHRWVEGKHQLQHRFVMERTLGRPLTTRENVHHRNGRRDDNRPENLELWVKPQASGQRVEDLVAWVIEHYPTYINAALTQRNSVQP